MPRARVMVAVPEAPLSVAAVSVRLGVSPSTLRTWERRYGLGPGGRAAGTHRRYQPEDVARLARMVELIRQGVSAADAARTVAAAFAPLDEEADPADGGVATGPDDIVAAARSGDMPLLERMVEAGIAQEGLVRTWTMLLEPALDAILGSHEGQDPGHAPSALLTTCVLHALARISDRRPPRVDGPLADALVMTDEEHTMAAHVLGVALQWRGISTSVLKTGRHAGTNGIERYRAHVAARPVRLVMILGRSSTCTELVSAVAEDGDVEVFLVGADTPPFLNTHVQRVRTLAACVEEVMALAPSLGAAPASRPAPASSHAPAAPPAQAPSAEGRAPASHVDGLPDSAEL